MDELISRRDVMHALEKCHKMCCREDDYGDEWIHYETTVNEIECIPSTQSEIKRRVGHWVPKERWVTLPPNTRPLYLQNYDSITNSIKTHYWYCSECDYVGSKDTKPTWNFCQHCGAEMKGEHDE